MGKKKLIPKVIAMMLVILMVASTGSSLWADEMNTAEAEEQTILETEEEADSDGMSDEAPAADSQDSSRSEEEQEKESSLVKDDTAAADRDSQAKQSDSHTTEQKKTLRDGGTNTIDITDWITSVEIWIAKTNSSGNPTGEYEEAADDYQFSNGDYIKIYLKYTVPDSYKSQMTSDTILAYQLPDYFGEITPVTDGKVTDSNYSSGPSGTYSVSSDGLVQIQFNQDYLNSGKLRGGDFSFEGTLVVQGTDETEMELIFGDISIEIKIKTEATLKIAKTGSIGTQNMNGDSTVDYKITATAPSSNSAVITDAAIVDTFGAGKEYITGYAFDGYSSTGNTTYENSDGDTITLDLANKTFTWTLSSIKPGETKKLTYTVITGQSIWHQEYNGSNTAADQGYSQVTVKNEAIAYISDEKTDQANAEVTFKKRWINKSASLNSDGTYTFTVYVNYDAPPAYLNGETVTDTLTGGTIKGDITVDRYVFDENGNRSLDTSFGNKGTLAVSGYDGAAAFDYQLDAGEYGYRITYHAEGSSDAGKVGNSAAIEVDDNNYEITVEQGGVTGVKTFDDYEVKDGYLYMNWTIKVTTPLYVGSVISDYFDSAASFKDYQIIDSVTLYYNGDKLKEGIHFTAASQGNTSYNMQMLQAFGAGVTVNVTTKIAISDLQAYQEDQGKTLADGVTIQNKVYFSADGSSNTKIYKSATCTYYEGSSLSKTLPSDYYDTDEQTITWLLTVNKNGLMSGTAYILEELPKGLEFVSAEIYSYGSQYSAENEPQLDSPAVIDTGSGYEQVQLTLTGLQETSAAGSDKAQVVIKVVTHIKDEDFRGTVTFCNKASVVNNFTENTPLVSVTCDAEVTRGSLDKDSAVSGSQVEYTIHVNKEAEQLIPDSGSELYIVDQWSENLMFHRDTLKVYKVIDGTEVETDDYKLEVDTEARQFKLTLEDSTYYLIRYYTTVSGTISETVSIVNHVSFYGIIEYAFSDEKTFTIAKSSSTSSSDPSIFITKYIKGTGDETLQGAEFTLAEVKIDENGSMVWEDAANQVPAAADGSMQKAGTDSNGKIEFDSLNRDTLYVYWESKAPTGYIQDTSYYYVYIIEDQQLPSYIDDLAEQGITVKVYQGSPSVEIDNEKKKGGLLVEKVSASETDSSDDPLRLEGAEFILYRGEDEDRDYYSADEHGNVTWAADRDNAAVLVTDKDGNIEITDLDWGTYYIEEIKAPVGYEISAAGAVEDITIDAENAGDAVEVIIENPKVEDPKLYSIQITKYVTYKEKYRAIDYSFYAALFWDEECTQRATEVKELKLESSYTTTVTFDQLAAGTYYVAETDKEGNALDFEDDEVFFTNKITKDVIVLTQEETDTEVIIINDIVSPPEGFLEEDDGSIQINKSVVKGDAEEAVTDTFYFTLYSDADMTGIIATQSLSLEEMSSGELTFSDLAYGTYYIAESNENGKPVGDDFSYGVSISDEMVTLTDSQTVTVDIVNDLEGSTEENEEGGDISSRPSPSAGGSGSSGTSRTSGSTRTGDTTHSMLYFIILLGAASAVAGIVYKRRRNV